MAPLDQYTKILNYISFNYIPRAPEYNEIDGIIANREIISTIKKVTEELNYKYTCISYDGNDEAFAEVLFSLLKEKGIIYVYFDSYVISSKLSSLIFDIRNFNRFSWLSSKTGEEHFLSPIPPSSHLFFIFDKEKIDNLNCALTDLVDSFLEL